MLLIKPKNGDAVNCCNEKMFCSTVDIPKHDFWNVDVAAVVANAIPVGSCFCVAVELSFSMLPETPENLEQSREKGL